MVHIKEVAKHNTKESLWVIIKDHVYDLTDFLPNHPGGEAIILKYAGKDATKKFVPIHASDTLTKYLPAEKHLGPLEGAVAADDEEEVDEYEKKRLEMVKAKPPLSLMYNLWDFEQVASKVTPKAGWYYYSSAADDEISFRENHAAFHRIWFKPRILIDVAHVDISTTIFGDKLDAPFYVTATALAKLANDEGEVALTRACAKENIVQMVATLASCSFDEIMDASVDKQTMWMQIYVNSDREDTKQLMLHAQERGVKAFFITVDAPQLGRREKDMRVKYEDDAASVQENEDTAGLVDRSQGAARAISSFIDASLSWRDIAWFKSFVKVPLILKGVQRAEDAVKAAQHGVDGVVLSNHGGRQLEFARSAIEILAETMAALKENKLEDKLTVFVDGGFRRGTDIIKALCLGAKGVGLGRPFLYALSAYGEVGVQRAMQLLKDELEMDMRLIGANTLADLSPDLLDIKSIHNHSFSPTDELFKRVYESLTVPGFKSKI